ncbi:MAG TPA: hypothetical protein VFL85_01150 [Candidatus Saccharimonadales bacterium]|nr:hypothetical protein [Candidatus Saccharimonadales bacterium]
MRAIITEPKGVFFMESSHLVRSLRLTFLAIGFAVFVIMAVRWVQHVSVAKPVVTPKVIAATPQANRAAATYEANDLHDTSLASFVRAANPADTASQPNAAAGKTPPASTPAAAATHPTQPHPTALSKPAKPAKPSVPLPPSSPTKPKVIHVPNLMTTPRDY